MTARVFTATVLTVLATVVLAACVAVPTPPASPNAPSGTGPAAGPPPDGVLARYRCDQGIAFTVRFDNGTARIDAGPRGTETLLRDAGGVTPRQTVYSSTTMRAHFGLEPDGRGARLNYLSPGAEVNCMRE